MKATNITKALDAAIKMVSRALPSRTPMPILTHIRLTTGDQALTLTASNLELSMMATLGASVQIAGDTTLPGKKFADVIAALADEKVSLEMVRDSVQFVSGRTAISLKGLPSADFPEIKTTPPGEGLTLPLAQLRLCFEAVAEFASSDDKRPVLTGVLLEFKPGGYKLYTTEGFALASSGVAMTVPQDWVGKKFLIPARWLKQIFSALGDDETITLSEPDNNRVQFSSKFLWCVAQTLEGTFPDVKSLVPRTSAIKAVVDSGELLRAVKTALLINQHGRLKFEPGAPGSLTITSVNADTGNSVIPLDATIEGESLELMVDLTYLKRALDGIQTLRGPNVRFGLNGWNKAMTLAPVGAGADQPMGMYIIMPMNLHAQQKANAPTEASPVPAEIAQVEAEAVAV